MCFYLFLSNRAEGSQEFYAQNEPTFIFDGDKNNIKDKKTFCCPVFFVF